VTIEELEAKIAELESRLTILEGLSGRDSPKPITPEDGNETS
jgi:BMFP domain-containing protein YqiC